MISLGTFKDPLLVQNFWADPRADVYSVGRLHRTRFPQPGRDPSKCLLEKCYQDSLDQGLRVRNKLRDGVEETLKILGTAYLQHPSNTKLREDCTTGKLKPESFHHQLLLPVDRLLFLMVAEERGLIVALGENAGHNQKIDDQ